VAQGSIVAATRRDGVIVGLVETAPGGPVLVARIRGEVVPEPGTAVALSNDHDIPEGDPALP
jgi:hypothetical protein